MIARPLITVFLSFLFAMPAVAQQATVSIVPGKSYSPLDPSVYYIEDTGWDLTLQDAQRSRAFKPLPTGEVNFGRSHSIFWLRLPLENASDSSGAWKLQLRARFMEPLHAWWIPTDGKAELLIWSERDMPFDEREDANRYLTGELRLSPGERGELLVRYASGGNTNMPVSLLTVEDLAAEEKSETVIAGLFAGALGMLIMVNLFQFFAVRRPAYLFYTLQELSILLYVLHMQGFTFKYLWPGAPLWNAMAAPVLGTAMTLFPALFMRSFLNTRERTPGLDKVVIFYLVVVAALIITAPFNDSRTANVLGLYTGVVLCALLLGSGLWYTLVLRDRPAIYYLLGWLAAGGGGLYFSMEQLDIYDALPFSGVIGLMLGAMAEAMMLSFALADQVRVIRVQRDDGQRKLLELAEERLAESQKLVEAERERRHALEVAQEQSERMAHTGHDLRSPIYALRMALQSDPVIRDKQEISDQLNRTLDYMSTMVSDLVKTERDTPPRAGELTRLGGLLKNCCERQQAKAKEKGLELRFVDTKLRASATGAILERILDNLVSNALRYTEEGKVLLGVRRRSLDAEIQVWDTGPGIRPADLIKIRESFVQSGTNPSKQEGFGLGLAIVDALCREIGAQLLVQSWPGRGSLFSILLMQQE